MKYGWQRGTHDLFLTTGMIMDRIEKLARDIRADYGDKTIHLLCVLKGGSAFFNVSYINSGIGRSSQDEL